VLHRATECRQFLIAIGKAVPAGPDGHLVCDDYGTHKTPGDPGLTRPASPSPHALHSDGLVPDQPGPTLVGFVTGRKIHRGAHESIQALPTSGSTHP
jgi:hypothetical protein